MHRAPRHGFTLIELILVLAMLAVVLALASPSLSRFFQGRKIDSEARRFLSVTRYGQSRAVSEGVPMVLWIDTRQNTYGLEAETSYLGSDSKALTYTVDDTLEMEVESPRLTTLLDPFQTASTIAGNLPFIRFQPDGFTSADSASWVLFQQKADDSFVYIGPGRNRLNYEIKTNQIPAFLY